MTDTTELEALKEEIKNLREQNRTDKVFHDQNIKSMSLKPTKLLDQLEKRVTLSRQNYRNLQSDDPSMGMRLTDQQRGQWEGRIEVWEYVLLLAQEIFEE